MSISNHDDKIGMMATYPPRMDSLKETLKSLLLVREAIYKLDILYIYCNEYRIDAIYHLSKFVADMDSDCVVKLIDPQFGEGNVRDMGKFWALHAVEGFVFLLDDDLIYPSDYVHQHVVAIQHHGGVSTVHGRNLKFHPIDSYFGDTRSLNYKRGLDDWKRIDIPGTGTVAFHTDFMQYPVVTKDIMDKYNGMSDVWFGCLCNRTERAIIAVPRPQNWLKDTEGSMKTSSLYVKTRYRTKRHCNFINVLDWPDVPAKSEVVT